MKANSRSIIADRIQAELDRRGLSLNDLSQKTSLSIGVLTDYVFQRHKLVLSDIKSICDAFGVNFISFISSDYTVPSLQFRGAPKECEPAIQRIENCLQMIKDFLPDPNIPSISPIVLDGLDRKQLITKAGELAAKVAAELGATIEKVYSEINLPIIPVFEKDFEAFFFASGGKYAVVCSARDKAEVRLNVTLAHELAHFLFDRDVGVEIDLHPSYFNNEIPKGMEREFFANKFAQFFLIPFSRAVPWGAKWPEVDLEDISSAMREGRASVEVASNVLCDILEVYHKKTPYGLVHDKLANAKRTQVQGVTKYLKQQRRFLANLLDEKSDEFSPDVFKNIKAHVLSWSIDN